MFTGIIQGQGVFRGFRNGEREMVIEAGALAPKVAPGGSIAVDGVCLTLVRRDGDRLVFNPLRETLERTHFRERRPGEAVNLECPLTPSDPLGGHFVSGHVDFTGKVKSLSPRGAGSRLTIVLPAAFRPFVVPQGSIALNGVSLTVAAVTRTSAEVELIPETMARTNLRGLRAGKTVHVECDMLGKYVYNFVNIRKR
jgi:riboflavin synthase